MVVENNTPALKITVDDVQKAWDKFVDPHDPDYPIYGMNDNALSQLFCEHQSVSNPDWLWAKMRLLDACYSTNLRMQPNDFMNLCEYFQTISSEFDKKAAGSGIDGNWTKNDSIDFVNKLNEVETNVKHPSFISKFVVLHNVNVYDQDDFVIYDNKVRNIIPKFLKTLNGKRLIQKNLTSYGYLYDSIDRLIEINDLQTLDKPRRMLDVYLWSYEGNK